jgi:hypothetical protein
LSSFSRVSVTFGQFVGDSCLDIAFVETLANRFGVAQGRCSLTFDPPVVTTMNNVSGIVGFDHARNRLDFNNDGHSDVAVSHGGFPPMVRVMLGNGAGAFTQGGSLQLVDQPAILAAGNVNGDTGAQIICGGAGLGDVYVIRVGSAGQVIGSQAFASGAPVADMALFDVDNDADLDIATVATGALGTVPGPRVLRNNGSGVFSGAELVNATGDFPQGLAAGDFDCDGDGDLASANLLSNTVSVFPGLPGGVMIGVSSLLTTPVGVHDVAAGDFDGDSDLDLAAMLMSSPNQRILVFENLTDPPTGAPGDVDGDGDVDVDDLIAVILAWGPCPTPPASCPADVNHSGDVDADDLVLVILNWG